MVICVIADTIGKRNIFTSRHEVPRRLQVSQSQRHISVDCSQNSTWGRH